MRNIGAKSDSDKYYSIDNEKPSLSFEIFKMNQELWRRNTQKIKSTRMAFDCVVRIQEIVDRFIRQFFDVVRCEEAIERRKTKRCSEIRSSSLIRSKRIVQESHYLPRSSSTLFHS